MKKFSEFKIQEQGEFERKQESNKKELQKLFRKAKSSGGQVHVTYKDTKGKTQKGYYNGMMRMGAFTYAKIEPLSGQGAMTALPIFQADKIEYVKDAK